MIAFFIYVWLIIQINIPPIRMKHLPLFLFITFFYSQNTFAQGDSNKNVKGMWVVRDILKSKRDIEKMLNDAEKARITDLFVQVRGRGDA